MGLVLAERYLAAQQIEDAKRTALAALALASRENDPHAAGRLSALLATICDAAGEAGAALRHRSRAIDAMRRLGDRRSTAELLIATATSGNTSSPEDSLRMASKLAQEIGWAGGVAASKEALL
jgi:hypothetical protein